MKCILASISSISLKSIVFGAPMCFWTLWPFELPYVCLDRLINMLFGISVSPLERAPKIMSVKFCQHGVNISTWYIYQCGYFGRAPIYHPALLLEALPHNFGLTSLVCLLPSCHSKGNLSLGVFSHLEKVAIISIWHVL